MAEAVVAVRRSRAQREADEAEWDRRREAQLRAACAAGKCWIMRRDGAGWEACPECDRRQRRDLWQGRIRRTPSEQKGPVGGRTGGDPQDPSRRKLFDNSVGRLMDLEPGAILPSPAYRKTGAKEYRRAARTAGLLRTSRGLVGMAVMHAGLIDDDDGGRFTPRSPHIIRQFFRGNARRLWHRAAKGAGQ